MRVRSVWLLLGSFVIVGFLMAACTPELPSFPGGDSTPPVLSLPADVSVPATRASGATVTFAAGNDHSCALLDQGAVSCWGANFAGQLGNNLELSLVPSQVIGLP